MTSESAKPESLAHSGLKLVSSPNEWFSFLFGRECGTIAC